MLAPSETNKISRNKSFGIQKRHFDTRRVGCPMILPLGCKELPGFFSLSSGKKHRMESAYMDDTPACQMRYFEGLPRMAVINMQLDAIGQALFWKCSLTLFLGRCVLWNFGLTYCRSCEFVASSRAWPRWPWGFLSQSLISSSWVCPQRKEWCAIPTWLSHHGTALELMSLHRFCCLAELTLAANRNIIFVKKKVLIQVNSII